MTEPGVVVKSTGTGKTETLLAAVRLGRLLVIVPATVLRNQVAGKFEVLGVCNRKAGEAS